jgi:hypothetical protein
MNFHPPNTSWNGTNLITNTTRSSTDPGSMPPGSILIQYATQLTEFPIVPYIGYTAFYPQSPVGLHQTYETYSNQMGASQPVPIAITTASLATPNPVVGRGEHLTTGKHQCPECGALYNEKKTMNRHRKDKHGPQNICFCGFTWSPGRNYVFGNHVRQCHNEVSPFRLFNVQDYCR